MNGYWDDNNTDTYKDGSGKVVTTTDKGEANETFKIKTTEKGAEVSLERDHDIQWRRETTTPADESEFAVYWDYYIPTVSPEYEQYLTTEFTNSTIETRNQNGDSKSSHAIDENGRARGGKLDAHSYAEETHTTRMHYSWDYSPPKDEGVNYQGDPANPDDDGFSEYSHSGEKTHDTVDARNSVDVTEKASYWDAPILGRVTHGHAKTVEKSTTGVEYSESGDIDRLEVGYYLSQDSDGDGENEWVPQHVVDYITHWESEKSDNTTNTVTTDTYYGGAWGGAAGFDLRSRDKTGGPTQSGERTTTSNSRIYTDSQNTTTEPVDSLSPPEQEKSGPVTSPSDAAQGSEEISKRTHAHLLAEGAANSIDPASNLSLRQLQDALINRNEARYRNGRVIDKMYDAEASLKRLERGYVTDIRGRRHPVTQERTAILQDWLGSLQQNSEKLLQQENHYQDLLDSSGVDQDMLWLSIYGDFQTRGHGLGPAVSPLDFVAAAGSGVLRNSAGGAATMSTPAVAKSIAPNANRPLVEFLADISDDALVHFAPARRTLLKTGPSGKSYAFRYGDIKHLSPRQVETLIGPLSQGGQKGGAKFLHVLESTLDDATRTSSPGGFSEYTLGLDVGISDIFIVQ